MICLLVLHLQREDISFCHFNHLSRNIQALTVVINVLYIIFWSPRLATSRPDLVNARVHFFLGGDSVSLMKYGKVSLTMTVGNSRARSKCFTRDCIWVRQHRGCYLNAANSFRHSDFARKIPRGGSRGSPLKRKNDKNVKVWGKFWS